MITVAFLDVGQGDSSVITLPDGKTAHLIDCPGGKSKVVTAYLKEKAISELDIVFVTHSDRDHANGIPSVVEDFGEVNALAWNVDRSQIQQNRRRRSIFQHLLLLHREQSIKRIEPRAETDDASNFQVQGVEIVILHPTTEDQQTFRTSTEKGKRNNASLLLRLSYGRRRVLFTSDLMLKGWQKIVDRKADLSADILKYPHHGAWYQANPDYSLEDVFVKVAPEFTVISTGTTNTYNHPNENSLNMLRAHSARFLCTQATERCWSQFVPSHEPVPCGGTIEIEVSEDGQLLFRTGNSPPLECVS